jgi:hypothetical protein
MYKDDVDIVLGSPCLETLGTFILNMKKMFLNSPIRTMKSNMSKVKCFACKKMGHYVGQCPNRKKPGGTATTTDEEEFQEQFERECAFLICCTLVETTPNIWYIYSGASSHMTGVREHFTDLRDREVKMEFALGDDTIVRVAGRGTITF